ncbi:MAG: hypothetical protein AAF224_03245 [Pseudomonadota bacterium]
MAKDVKMAVSRSQDALTAGVRAIAAPIATGKLLLLASFAFVSLMVLTPTPAAADGYGFRGAGWGHVGGPYGRGFYRDRFYRRGFHRGGFYGGGFYRRGFYGHPWYGPGFRRGGFYHPGPRYYRRGGLSGGEAALIAAGVIGGVILIDRALERQWEDERARAYVDARARERARRRFYEERGYRLYDGTTARDRLDDREDGLNRERRRLESVRRDLEADRRAFERERDAYEQRRRDPRYDQEPSDRRFDRLNGSQDIRPRGNRGEHEARDLDDELLGAGGLDRENGRRSIGVSNNRFLRAAFDACAGETRRAAAEDGLMAALPGAPALVDVDAGGVYRLEADFTVNGDDGETYRRTMRCEADEAGVAFLEIV